MSSTDILSIIGVVATIGFGILGYYMVRNKRYPGKVVLVKQTKLSLFNNIAKNFDEISISYKNNPIKENVIYIKASFINDGEVDIEGKTVEIPISLMFKSGFKWIKSKITETSENLNCESQISNDGANLEFNFGLFRKKEFFQFEALIETVDENFNSDNVFDNIEIKHRISNTQKINSEALLTNEQIKKKKGQIKTNALSLGLQMAGVVVLIVAQIFFFKSTTIHYIDNQQNEYKATAKTDNTVELDNINSSEEIIVDFEEFSDRQKFKPIIPQGSKWQKVRNVWYIFPMFLLGILILALADYWQIRKANKLNRILKCNEK